MIFGPPPLLRKHAFSTENKQKLALSIFFMNPISMEQQSIKIDESCPTI